MRKLSLSLATLFCSSKLWLFLCTFLWWFMRMQLLHGNDKFCNPTDIIFLFLNSIWISANYSFSLYVHIQANLMTRVLSLQSYDSFLSLLRPHAHEHLNWTSEFLNTLQIINVSLYAVFKLYMCWWMPLFTFCYR